MSHRHPAVPTTMEEDFRELGIIMENADPAPDPEAADPSDPLAEFKLTRTKRHTASERRKWKMAKRKGGARAAARQYRKKSSVKRRLKLHRKRADRMRKGKPAGRRRLTFGNDVISNMLEEVQEIVAGLGSERVEHSVKAFANIAIISELLARAFASFSKETNESADKRHFEESAAHFSSMAEEAAEVAKALSAGPGDDEEFDLDEIGKMFKAQMSDLLNGLEMYADLTEDEELSSLSVTEEDDEDEDEDEEDDEDEDDEEEEGEKKVPPFLKKKK
jgi:hypothetical protein